MPLGMELPGGVTCVLTLLFPLVKKFKSLINKQTQGKNVTLNHFNSGTNIPHVLPALLPNVSSV